jgi:protocatechuate 3,4-dioxygenase beta subunit
MSHNDDSQVGRLLSRREVLALFGSAGAALLVACSGDDGAKTVTQPESASTRPPAASTQTAGAPTASASASASAAVPQCVVRPEQTVGPYFVDEKLNRSDIRTDASGGAPRPGAPLQLTFNVSRVGSANACTPLQSAIVDVWHCDATGQYSDVDDRSIGFNTRGQKWLRGFQNTDASGKATFTTIFPGWYQGRAVHIHFKIRSGSSEFTSQLFFNEALIDQVYAQAPYSQKSGKYMRNSQDGIYRDGGSQLMLAPTKTGEAYAATFDIALKA